jgi:4-amino-4-deoxy-L-arabinose transferase-like glycosyltransferase
MNARHLALWALLGFALVAVTGVLLRPLTVVDETRYISVAWEMWLSGDHLVPTKNFEIYTHKPPLLFWSINLVWAVFGVTEFAGRLVGPAYALLAIWLTGRLAAKLWPEDTEIGARAMTALAGMMLFAVYGGLTMFDAMLAVAVLAALLAIVQAIDTGAWRWWAALGVALAVGALAKGPVVLLHVLPAALFAPLWAAERVAVSWRFVVKGVFLAVVVALACVSLWLIPAIVSGGPEYRDAVLWTQHAGRVTQSFAHARPWWFFLALLPLLLFPWLWVPQLWRAARQQDWAEPGLRLALVWGGVGLALFSLVSGKQGHYVVPELAAAALIVARLLRGAPAFRPVLAALPLAVLGLVLLAASAGLVPLGALAAVLQPASALLLCAVSLLVVAGLSLWLGGPRGAVVLGLGAVLSANLLIGQSRTAQVFDTHRIAEILAPYSDKGIAYMGLEYNAEFNFAGRMTTPVALPADEAAREAWQADHAQGVIFGRMDRVSLPWPPAEQVFFANETYGLWHVSDAPANEVPK